MSVNIPTHYAQQFATNIQLLLQQKGSRFRNAVMEGSHVGKQASPVDQFGSVVAQKVTTRFGDMPRIDASTDRRWVFPVDYDLPQLLDSFDKLRLITDPQSSYTLNGTYALGRAMDDEVITALTGTAKTGESGSTSTTLPAAQKVAVNFGSASDVGLTVAKLREARRLLMAAEVDLDNDPLYCAVSALAHDNLLAEAQVISTDFNEKPVLVEGKVVRFLGFNFIHTERLTTSSGDRLIPCWVKSGMHLGMWGDVRTDISQRKDLQGLPWQVYVYGTFGATRLEEKKVVQIACNE